MTGSVRDLLYPGFLSLVLALVPLSGDTARAQQSVPLLYEARETSGTQVHPGRELAELISAALAGDVVPTSVGATRANALLDGPAEVCVVLHGRSPEREARRRWVGELWRNRTFLVSPAPYRGEPGPSDTIVVLGGSPYEAMARQLSGKVEAVKSRAQIFQMVQVRRADYWVEDQGVLDWLRAQQWAPDLYIVRELVPMTAWLACSLSVSDDLVDRLAEQVRSLDEAGTLARLLGQPVSAKPALSVSSDTVIAVAPESRAWTSPPP